MEEEMSKLKGNSKVAEVLAESLSGRIKKPPADQPFYLKCVVTIVFWSKPMFVGCYLMLKRENVKRFWRTPLKLCEEGKQVGRDIA